MIAELGQAALILAFVVALLQAVLGFAGVAVRDPVFHRFARSGAMVQFVLVAAAFACLTALFAVSDFSVLVVAQNSHTLKPLIYKLSGVWGNHEGSMLLWALILTAYTAALALFARHVAPRLITLTFSVQSLVTAAFLAFLIFTSNPFARLWPVPLDGADLNPLLQDPGLATHPPMLYAGYVGFSITFSFAVAALIEGRVDARWARIVRPWALTAWTFLTIGIALGASWLAGTAFIHSLRVMEKRDTLKAWTILLALVTFSLSLVGTFLVRSGVITSVHAFAVDPQRGVFILGILLLVIGGSLALYGLRAGHLKPTGVFAEVSRESTLLVNNLFLAAACALVFFGTFYPLFITTVSDETISIGAPFYHATFIPMMAVLFLLIPVSAMLAWKRGKLGPIARKLTPAFIAAIAAGLIALWVAEREAVAGAIGTALAVWVGLGVLLDLKSRLKLFETDFAASWARAKRLPAAIWGMTVAHLGIAVLIFAVTGVSAWKDEASAFLMPGQSMELDGYVIELVDVERSDRENFVSQAGTLAISRGGRELGEMVAERRFYPVREMATTESAIRARLDGDLYVTIGEGVEGRGWAVHAYVYPLAVWLWIGAASCRWSCSPCWPCISAWACVRIPAQFRRS